MKNEIFKLIFVLFAVSLVAIPYVLEAPKRSREEAERDRAAEEARQREIAEKKNYLMGKFDPALRNDFVPVLPEHKVVPQQMYLRKEAYDAFIKMRAEALKSGITLNVASATRNFNYQKMLWENKSKAGMSFEQILEYSAAPGTSRHHWGTDIDINGADPAYFNTAYGQKVYAWLYANAPRFGYCQVYDDKTLSLRPGYNEEKWHWSYLPLARDFFRDYPKLVSRKDISGFTGDSQVESLNLIPNYVLSINRECL